MNPNPITTRLYIDPKALSNANTIRNLQFINRTTRLSPGGLRKLLAKGEPTTCLISGYRGSGKSVFLQHLQRHPKGCLGTRCYCKRLQFINVPIREYDSSDPSSYRYVMRAIIRELYAQRKEILKKGPPKSLVRLSRQKSHLKKYRAMFIGRLARQQLIALLLLGVLAIIVRSGELGNFALTSLETAAKHSNLWVLLSVVVLAVFFPLLAWWCCRIAQSEMLAKAIRAIRNKSQRWSWLRYFVQGLLSKDLKRSRKLRKTANKNLKELYKHIEHDIKKVREKSYGAGLLTGKSDTLPAQANGTYLAKQISEELYDDEIELNKLCKTLQCIHDLRIQLVIIFDELDKLEKDGLEKLFKRLKPLFLSGHATFLFVTGQNFYYKVLRARLDNDSALASFFGGHLHIKLLSPREMSLLFRKLHTRKGGVAYSNTMDLRLLKKFQAYLGITTAMNPRRLVNAVRRNLRHDPVNKAFYIDMLSFDNDHLLHKFDKYLSDHETLEEIVQTLKNDFINNLPYAGTVRDYYYAMLLTYIKTAKTHINSAAEAFTVDDILRIARHSTNKAHSPPAWLPLQCEHLLEILLEYMREKAIISKVAGKGYRWQY